MSADNWTECPRCRDEAGIYARTEDLMTFREDYEWWTVDGVLQWSYKGACSVCGLSVTEAGSKSFYEPKATVGA